MSFPGKRQLLWPALDSVVEKNDIVPEQVGACHDIVVEIYQHQLVVLSHDNLFPTTNGQHG